MYLIVIALLSSCQFKPVYMSDNLEDKLCTISVNDERKSAGLYEIEFKNDLQDEKIFLLGEGTKILL